MTSPGILSIAGKTLSSPYILAPLAGYTDLPFRLLCRELGASLCVSEMISCHALCYRQKKTLAMLQTDPAERPVSFQLFGAEADLMGEAAAIMSSYGPDMIDINMGCPVKKVTKKGAGAALMASPETAARIISKVCANTRLPVTVKIRLGVDRNQINAVTFARMAEDMGAKAIIVHGRTWSQGFSGTVDRKEIALVKQAVSLPVIGNGDVTNLEEAQQMMRETGCDGVMIGRAALHNPRLFTGEPPSTTLSGIVRLAARHLELIEQYGQQPHVHRAIAYRIGRYFRDFPGSAVLRKGLYASTSLPDLHKRLQELEP